MKENNIEYETIARLIEKGRTVLDLGCGNGELLEYLVHNKQINGQGIDIDEQCIYNCVAKGLSVCHGDVDTGLDDYSDKSFDYVLLNQTFQQVKRPDFVIKEALRVGKKVIVGFPNFVYYKARLRLFIFGRVPVFQALPYRWYNTPNLHFLSIKDFRDYCIKESINIEKQFYFSENERTRVFPNIFAQTAVLLISKTTK